MKKLAAIAVCLLLASCQYFSREVPSREVLLKQQLDSVNFSKVDELPSVPTCDSLPDKAARGQCFIDFMAGEIQRRLSADTLTVRYAQFDTIPVRITVSRNSALRFDPQFPKRVAYDTVFMDSLIQARLLDFPRVSPALKRGLPVQSQFVLPVILNITH